MARTLPTTRAKSTSLRILVSTKTEMPTMVALSANPIQFHELRVRGFLAVLSVRADNQPPCDARASTTTSGGKTGLHPLPHVVTSPSHPPLTLDAVNDSEATNPM